MFNNFKSQISKIFSSHRIDDASLEKFEDLLIMSDIDLETSSFIISKLKNEKFIENPSIEKIQSSLEEIIKNILSKNKKINCVADDWRFFNQQKCFEYFLISKKLFFQNKKFTSRIQNNNEKKKIAKNSQFILFQLINESYLKPIIHFSYQWLKPKIILKKNI